MKDRNILAIDFGTSNSLIGGWVSGDRVDPLPIDPEAPDPTLMRTLLYFPHENLCFYGLQAIAKYIENQMEGRFFRSFKSQLPNQHYLGTYVEDRVVPLENMVGLFLLELKRRAERLLGCQFSAAIVGRPARYSLDPASDSFALHRMHKAVEFAGFEDYTFVPEPLAAALDFRKGLTAEKIVLIGDFGGGTSDFTLIRLRKEDFKPEDVLAVEGCPLAGDALDSLFMSQRLNENFGAKIKYQLPLSKNILTMPPSIVDRINRPSQIVHLKEKATYEFIKEIRKCLLRDRDRRQIDQLFVLIEDQQIYEFFDRIESTKKALSNSEQALFDFHYPGISVHDSFSRTQFTGWAEDIRRRIFHALDEGFRAASISPDQVDLVCMTGGTAQVPMIREELIKRFGEQKLQTQSHFHSVINGLIEFARLASTS